MPLRLGSVQHSDGGLQLGSVEWQTLEDGDGSVALVSINADAGGQKEATGGATSRVGIDPEPSGAAWQFERIGTIFQEGATIQGYFPCLLDTRDIPHWPWTVTFFGSSDHLGGAAGAIYLGGAKGDPTDLAMWETYAQARARGAFNAWSSATGQAVPTAANGPAVEFAGLDSEETPVVHKIGTTWYLTFHDRKAAGAEPYQQVTRLAKATGGPLNFTLLANGAEGMIVRAFDASGNQWPTSPAQSHHRGYLRWGPNKFRKLVNPATGQPWVYSGVCGANPSFPKFLCGSDNAETWTQIGVVGAHAGLTPNWAADFAQTTDARDAQVGLRIHECCWNSISEEINGEHYIITAGRTVAEKEENGIYQAVVGADGFTETRRRIKLLPMEGSDAEDAAPGRTGMPWSIPWDDGKWLLVYREQINDAEYVLRLAVGTFNPSAQKPPPLAFPNHEKYTFDARGASGLPNWLEVANGGSVSFSASGMAVNAALRFSDPINPATTPWAEVYAWEAPGNPQNGSAARIGFATDGYETAIGNQASEVVGYVGADLSLSMKYRQAGVDHFVSNGAWTWKQQVGTVHAGNQPQSGRRHRHGLRWYIADGKVVWLIGGRNRAGYGQANKFDVIPFAQITEPVYPSLYSVGTPNVFERVEVRIGVTSGAGVRPVISVAEAISPTQIDLQFDRACIGDCNGISIYDDDALVSGVWTRSSLTTARFTRSTGTWSGALAYDIVGTDIRSEDDLVALADEMGGIDPFFGDGSIGGGSLVGVNISAEADGRKAVSGGSSASVQVSPQSEGRVEFAPVFTGPPIGNRVMRQGRPSVVSVSGRFSGATSYSLTGTLPAGMSFSSATGAISGTPTTIQVRTGLKVSGINAADATDSDVFSIEVIEYVDSGSGGVVAQPSRSGIAGGVRSILRYD